MDENEKFDIGKLVMTFEEMKELLEKGYPSTFIALMKYYRLKSYNLQGGELSPIYISAATCACCHKYNGNCCNSCVLPTCADKDSAYSKLRDYLVTSTPYNKYEVDELLDAMIDVLKDAYEKETGRIFPAYRDNQGFYNGIIKSDRVFVLYTSNPEYIGTTQEISQAYNYLPPDFIGCDTCAGSGVFIKESDMCRLEQKHYYKTGNKFRRNDKIYILAQVLPQQAVLIALKDGNRYCDPVAVKNIQQISEEEFDDITDGNTKDFMLIKQEDEPLVKNARYKSQTWKLGDRLHRGDGEEYILARTGHGNEAALISLRDGNIWSGNINPKNLQAITFGELRPGLGKYSPITSWKEFEDYEKEN